jgi:hypothetical protein
MVHFCIFSGHQAQLRPGRTAYITLFGALDLRRPPVAAQFVELRREAPAAVDRRWCFFMTVFGGTTITWPTLADEYLALLDGVRIGALTLADWDAFAGRLCTEGPPHVAARLPARRPQGGEPHLPLAQLGRDPRRRRAPQTGTGG